MMNPAYKVLQKLYMHNVYLLFEELRGLTLE